MLEEPNKCPPPGFWKSLGHDTPSHWTMEEPGVHSPGHWGSLRDTSSCMWVGTGSARQTMPGFQEELKHGLLIPTLSLIINGQLHF